jgi:beta-glucanase (GH16 family)
VWLTAVLGGSAFFGLLWGCDGGGGDAADDGDVSPTSWSLVWQDEFEGERLDRESWNVEVMPDPYNEELQYYPDRADDTPGANVWTEDGILVIEARREDFEHRQYTSARINTKGKREFLYGRFEARLRLPAEVGMWPAFWMLGGNIDQVGWPACGEIDIMEGKGRLPNWTSGALHRGPDAGSNLITTAEYVLPTGDFHQEWHLFAVEWWPRQIRWYVDDVLFQVVDRPSGVAPAYWPFDQGQPFFLILNLAVGGWFDTPHMPPENMEPQRLLVDYVRVYRRTTPSGS